MSASLRRNNLTFSKLRCIRDVFLRSNKEWTKKGLKKNPSLTQTSARKSRERRGTGDAAGKCSFTPFRAMIDNCYQQANRSLLVQLDEQDSLCDLLNRVHHTYGTLERGFSYPVENGKHLVMIELTNKQHLDHSPNLRVKKLSDLKKENSRNETLLRKIEEYKPKTLQLDKLGQCESVTDQIMFLHKEMQMSEAMVRLHFFVGMLVTRTIRKHFQDAQAMFFGSSSCGLAVEGKSDLDMVILMDGIEHPNDLLCHMSEVLKGSKSLFRNTAHIRHARVPVVKFNQIHTNMSCDLICNTLTGVLMAEMLHWLNAYEPMFYPLVMTVKIWGREHHLTSQGLGCHFSNHMLTMLVLAYLQQEEILPALKTLYARKDKSVKRSGSLSTWRETELKNVKQNVNKIFLNKDIGSLLLGFFQYYSNFPFHDYIIDVHFGKIIKRPHKYEICVLNPHETGHNVCKNVRALQLDRFQEFCKHSAKLLGMYQQKSTDGSPWGLACVLCSETLKQKKRGKMYDLDIDFSAVDGSVEKVAVEIGADEHTDVDNGDELDIYNDIFVDNVHDTKAGPDSFLTDNRTLNVSKQNSFPAVAKLKKIETTHSDNEMNSSLLYTENISQGDLHSRRAVFKNTEGHQGKHVLNQDNKTSSNIDKIVSETGSLNENKNKKKKKKKKKKVQKTAKSEIL